MITLIHRQETMSFLGVPIVRYINIDDAEGVLNAIRATPSGTPIDSPAHPWRVGPGREPDRQRAR